MSFILSISSGWTHHINQLIISLPPYGLRPGWVRVATARIVSPVLIRTIMPSPSQGPVTPNGVAPSLRLVSEIPVYERWRKDMLQCHSARAAEPAEQLPCVRGGRIRATKERSKKRNWMRGRWKIEGGEGQNLDQSDIKESMKLTRLTSGSVWCTAVSYRRAKSLFSHLTPAAPNKVNSLYSFWIQLGT